jgi:hypothetical protein
MKMIIREGEILSEERRAYKAGEWESLRDFFAGQAQAESLS